MRALKTSWQHIRRSPYQTTVAIFVIGVTFYLGTIFALLVAGSQVILNYFETRPQVTAFFKDEVKTGQAEELKNRLEATGKVAEMKYVSKEEALAIYKEQNKNDPSLLEMVTADILPASLEISAKDVNFLSEIAQVLKGEPGVEEVIFQEEMVASLKTWTTNIRRAGLELVGSLILISFLVISVIVGIKVVFRKEEVETLRLIGASNFYIQLPFLLEGAFYGAIGAFWGWGFCYLRVLYLAPNLAEFFHGLPLPPVPPLAFMLLLLGVEIGAGIVIGFFGSFLAIRRYLK